MPELSVNQIRQRIYFIRGHRVMLDSDLAEMYQVQTKNLNKAVRRNHERFPLDFMFELTTKEYESLRFQIGTLETQRGAHRKYVPLVFTEHGVTMLSSVLKSKRAVQINIAVVRAFVGLREILETNKELAKKIDQLEKKLHIHDDQFKAIFSAIRQLMSVGSPLIQKKIKGLSSG